MWKWQGALGTLRQRQLRLLRIIYKVKAHLKCNNLQAKCQYTFFSVNNARGGGQYGKTTFMLRHKRDRLPTCSEHMHKASRVAANRF